MYHSLYILSECITIDEMAVSLVFVVQVIELIRGVSTRNQLINFINNATDAKLGEFVRNIQSYILKSVGKVR